MMLLQSASVLSYLFFLMLKETKSQSAAANATISYKWAESDPDFAGNVTMSWGRDGSCQISQGNMGQQNIFAGTCSAPALSLTPSKPGPDQRSDDQYGAAKLSWQYTTTDLGTCKLLNTLIFSIFPKGDQKSPQQFRVKLKDICCDQKCKETNYPAIDCLYGPPGKVLNWNGGWIDPCFHLPKA